MTEAGAPDDSADDSAGEFEPEPAARVVPERLADGVLLVLHEVIGEGFKLQCLNAAGQVMGYVGALEIKPARVVGGHLGITPPKVVPGEIEVVPVPDGPDIAMVEVYRPA